MELNTLSSEAATAAITRRSSTRRAARRLAGIAGAAALCAGAVTAPIASATAVAIPDASADYSYQTLNNNADPTFNQLLGINNNGLIAGYFGSGMPDHPNKGYVLHPGGSYTSENFPGSEQTQVTGIDDNHITVGFWVDGKGNNNGFYAIHGIRFHTANYPESGQAKTRLDQLLGVNDHGIAVGFWADSEGNNHGYTYNIETGRFGSVHVSGLTNISATGINNLNDISGFGTNGSGDTVAFLLRSDGKVVTLAVPGATMTQAFGVNDGDEVVGQYVVGSGDSAMTYGFVWMPGVGFETINDPNGVGATTVNGIDDRGDLVGFYTDSAGNTDGMLAQPML